MNDRTWPTEKEYVRAAPFKFKMLYFLGCYKKHACFYSCGQFHAYWRLRWWNPFSWLYVLIALVACVFVGVLTIFVFLMDLLSNIGYEDTFLDNSEEAEI